MAYIQSFKNNLIQKFNYLDPVNPNSDAFTSATWHIDERTWTTAPSELILNYQGGQSGDDYAWYGFLFYSRELTSRFNHSDYETSYEGVNYIDHPDVIMDGSTSTGMHHFYGDNGEYYAFGANGNQRIL